MARAMRETAVAPSSLTLRGQRTRAALVKAARAVFERRGYHDTRVVDITKAAGVAYGTFYTYFDSKELIFAEVVEELHRDFRAE
ncbi:MAG TPA: helix-turn-helix domain-containing protein, partial [Acidimicrobiales bacterium]